MSPSRVTNGGAGRAVCLLLAAVLLFAAFTGGACLMRGISAAGDVCGESIVAFDVCGAGQSSVTVQGADLAALSSDHGLYFPVVSFIPPQPVTAVASAEPGEAEKPPEA